MKYVRRLPFVAAALCGSALIVVLLASSELRASRAADQLIRLASPFVTRSGLHQMRSDLELLRASADGLLGSGVPRLAALAHQRDTALLAGYPQVTAALARLPAAQKLAEKVIGNLERRRAQFATASALPGLGLSRHRSVLLAILFGAALAVAGIAGLWRPHRWLAAGLTAIGALMVIVPLAASYPSRTADADAIVDSLRPFTVAKVQAREQALAAARAVFDGFERDILPSVAGTAHVTVGKLVGELGGVDPRLSAANIAASNDALDRFGGLVRFSAEIQPLLQRSDALPATALTWLLVVPGAVLVLAGAVGLAPAVTGRRTRET